MQWIKKVPSTADAKEIVLPERLALSAKEMQTTVGWRLK